MSRYNRLRRQMTREPGSLSGGTRRMTRTMVITQTFEMPPNGNWALTGTHLDAGGYNSHDVIKVLRKTAQLLEEKLAAKGNVDVTAEPADVGGAPGAAGGVGGAVEGRPTEGATDARA